MIYWRWILVYLMKHWFDYVCSWCPMFFIVQSFLSCPRIFGVWYCFDIFFWRVNPSLSIESSFLLRCWIWDICCNSVERRHDLQSCFTCQPCFPSEITYAFTRVHDITVSKLGRYWPVLPTYIWSILTSLSMRETFLLLVGLFCSADQLVSSLGWRVSIEVPGSSTWPGIIYNFLQSSTSKCLPRLCLIPLNQSCCYWMLLNFHWRWLNALVIILLQTLSFITLTCLKFLLTDAE